ncbi:MAG TPA: triacylglycerol lipase, partial [Psychrobacter sp.]|nr:triacylglycerol lipase [Psychrobacter sp.]
MGMFDYKNYSSNEAAKLVEDISLLSAYTNSFKIGGFIPGVDVLNTVGKLTGDLLTSEVNLRIPDGWTELTASDIGLSNDAVDNSGFFTIPSFFTGTIFEGPQAKVFGQYNEAGELVRINFDVAGTNGLADIIDYTNLNSREGVELFEPILKVVQEFAESNGLQGSDV